VKRKAEPSQHEHQELNHSTNKAVTAQKRETLAFDDDVIMMTSF